MRPFGAGAGRSADGSSRLAFGPARSDAQLFAIETGIAATGVGPVLVAINLLAQTGIEEWVYRSSAGNFY